MLQLDFINARGDVLHLTENDLFYLTNVDGQTLANTSVSSEVIGGIDGDIVNNIQAQPRDIVLDLTIKNNVDVERAKREILQKIKLKQKSALKWTQAEKTVVINGYVTGINMPRWQNGIVMQITLHCAMPFWEDEENVLQEISEAINAHYFTDYENDMLYFTEAGIILGEYNLSKSANIYNYGDVSAGLDIEIDIFGKIRNPFITNDNGEFFGIGYGYDDKQIILEAGDKITMSTTKGNKTVKLNGINIFDKIKPNSTWLQLEPGDNTFTLSSEYLLNDEHYYMNIRPMTMQIKYKQRYV